jgi:hypothetical protein
MRTIPVPVATTGNDTNWDPGDRPWTDGAGNDRPWARPGGIAGGSINVRHARTTLAEPLRVGKEVRAP